MISYNKFVESMKKLFQIKETIKIRLKNNYFMLRRK